jgi:hypothetical protein
MNDQRLALTKSDQLWLLAPALAKLLVHLIGNAIGGYGIFRDELYFLACGQHLAWGYVDQPPLIAAVAAFTRWLLGDSLFAIRFFPAVAGALVVYLTGRIARELGGGRFAGLLAQTGALIAPVFLAIHSILSMNVFEHLWWTLAVYLLVLLVNREEPRLWIAFGGVAGMGLLTKHSMGFFGVAVAAGLLLTRERRQFAQRWIWLGGEMALLLALPHVAWQVQNGFPMWELLRNGQLYKNTPFALGAFVSGVFLEMHPVNLLLAAGALWFLLLAEEGRRFRFLGMTVVVLIAMFIALKAKPYYVAPIYPLLLAAGGVAVGNGLARRAPAWSRAGLVVVMLTLGAMIAPLAMPALPVETFIRYQAWLGISGPANERHRRGALPQFFADMHGWQEIAQALARVWNTLTPEEKARAAIFCSNYGSAGAVDFYGRALGLPRAVSGHNSYFLWGPPQHTVEIVITFGESREGVEETFADVREAARFDHPYVMPYEKRHPIYIARQPKADLRAIWPRVKNYI